MQKNVFLSAFSILFCANFRSSSMYSTQLKVKTGLRELTPCGQREPFRGITQPSLHLLAEYRADGLDVAPEMERS